MTEGLSRIKDMPYSIKDQPTLTFVARQKGEAWNRPFVAVYEPSTVKEPSCISSVDYPQVKSEQKGSHVGIRVVLTNGNIDWILSSDEKTHHCALEKLQACAGYALCRQSAEGETLQAFLGDGSVGNKGSKHSYGFTGQCIAAEAEWKMDVHGYGSLSGNCREEKIHTFSC